jgi:hypothetical protein
MLRILKLALMGLLFYAPARAEKLAFVVGINRYENLPPLQNATGDAQAIAEAFRNTDYRTTQLADLSRDIFWQEWSVFVGQIKPGDEVAFFFSGHGLQIGSANFLLAGDAPLPPDVPGADLLIRENAIEVSKLLADLGEKKPRVSLIILDACRDNPFRKARAKGIGNTKGLAALEPPEGTFVMYSAGAGEQALDGLPGDDRKAVSVYMRRLLPLLKTSHIRIQDVAVQVRDEVRAIAAAVSHSQNPAYYDELRGNFCFSGCSEGGTTTVTMTNRAKKQAALSSQQSETPDSCISENPNLSCLWKGDR